MIELARRLFEAKSNKDKKERIYVKALLYYHEGNYKKAARLFSKVNSHNSIYMSILANVRIGNKPQALQSMYDYLSIVETWPTTEEKEEAIERIKELKEIIKN